MARGSGEAAGMTVAPARPPHRSERPRRFTQGEDANVAGYGRCFGWPSEVVGGAGGEQVLVGMADEAPVARGRAAVDEVIGFGERGFGIDLDPVAGLVAAV